MTGLTQTAGDFLTIREVTEKILADLTRSLEAGEGTPDSGRLRFNRTAALATLARVHQFRGEAALAREYALRGICERPAYVDWHDPAPPEGYRLLESELIGRLYHRRGRNLRAPEQRIRTAARNRDFGECLYQHLRPRALRLSGPGKQLPRMAFRQKEPRLRGRYESRRRVPERRGPCRLGG